MTLEAFARGVLSAFDARTALDVLLLAVLVYLGLLGLQQARTARALRGALLLAALYLLARQLDLALTSGALEAFLVVLLVALVMIYREELRRMVERVARLGRFSREIAQTGRTFADMLAETACELATMKCGALIVIAGDDSLEPHISEGTLLGGQPSAALLKSIFDPSSVGHDGALVIDGGQVTRFSAHLPLSRNVEVLGERGTRHAAALGLSERADALCIVVSEERGVVTIARHGAFHEIADEGSLEQAIVDHLGEERRPKTSAFRGLVFGHNGSKVVALSMAAVAWLVLVYGGEPMSASVDAEIQLRDAGTPIAEVTPKQVRVLASGTRRDFVLAGANAARVVLSLKDLSPGHHQLVVSADDVTLPRGLSFKSAVPTAVRVQLRLAAK